jgi:hypothetical protein
MVSTIRQNSNQSLDNRTVDRLYQFIKNHYLLIAVIVLLLATLVRVYALEETSLKRTEYITYQRVTRAFGDMLSNTAMPGDQVPLYYIIIHLAPHDNELLLRIPGVLAGIATVALMIAGVRLVFRDTLLSIITGIILAFSSIHVEMSRLARMYGLVTFLSLLGTILFLQFLQRSKRSRLWWTLMIASHGLSYLTHYSAFAIPATQLIIIGIVFLRKEKTWQDIRTWVLAHAIALIPILIWQFIFAIPSFRTRPGSIINDFGKFTKILNDLGGTSQVPAMGAIFFICVGIVAVFVFIRHDWQLLTWLILGTVPFIGVFVYSLNSTRPIFEARYFTVLIPAMILIVLNAGWQIHRYIGYITGLLVTMMFIQGTVYELSTTHYEVRDWNGAIEYVRDNAHDDDLIFDMNGGLNRIIDFYVNRYNVDFVEVLKSKESESYLQSDLKMITGGRVWISGNRQQMREVQQWSEEQNERFKIIEKQKFHYLEVWLLEFIPVTES